MHFWQLSSSVIAVYARIYTAANTCSETLGIRRLSRTKTRDAGRLRHCIHRATEAKLTQICDFPAGTGVTLTSVLSLAANVSTILRWRARPDDGKHSGR